jgi:hypothetical protein
MSLQSDNQEEAAEEFGWKLIHGDVFRAPSHPMLFAIIVGTGTQVFSMVVLTLLFACFGFLSPGASTSVPLKIHCLTPFSFLIGSHAWRVNDINGCSVCVVLGARWLCIRSPLQGVFIHRQCMHSLKL